MQQLNNCLIPASQESPFLSWESQSASSTRRDNVRVVICLPGSARWPARSIGIFTTLPALSQCHTWGSFPSTPTLAANFSRSLSRNQQKWTSVNLSRRIIYWTGIGYFPEMLGSLGYKVWKSRDQGRCPSEPQQILVPASHWQGPLKPLLLDTEYHHSYAPESGCHCFSPVPQLAFRLLSHDITTSRCENLKQVHQIGWAY